MKILLEESLDVVINFENISNRDKSKIKRILKNTKGEYKIYLRYVEMSMQTSQLFFKLCKNIKFDITKKEELK